MEDNKMDSLPESSDSFYNEKNDAIYAPDSYYSEKNTDSSSDEDRYYEVMDSSKPKTKAFSVVSLTLGIISILFCFIGWLGFIVGIAAIAFSAVSRIKLGYFDSMSVAGLILGIFGVVFGAFYMIFTLIFGSDGLFGILSDPAGGTNGDSSVNGI